MSPDGLAQPLRASWSDASQGRVAMSMRTYPDHATWSL
jgi:hypothetical protein